MRSEVLRLYSLERNVTDGYAVLGGRAQAERLRRALIEGGEERQGHARRLQTICERMGWKADGLNSKILQGIQWEVRETLSDAPSSPVTDVMIIAVAQRIQHLEIASYGTARALAYRMGESECARLLSQDLDDVKRADGVFTEIAETGLNQAAVTFRDDATRR